MGHGSILTVAFIHPAFGQFVVEEMGVIVADDAVLAFFFPGQAIGSGFGHAFVLPGSVITLIAAVSIFLSVIRLVHCCSLCGLAALLVFPSGYAGLLAHLFG